MITFDKKKHKYHDKRGQEYLSVTTLISLYFPFNGPQIALDCSNNPNSQYYGQSPKDILKEWRDSGKEGNKLHYACEQYIKEQIIDKRYKKCISQFAKLNFKGKLISEARVWHEGLLLAGTADIIEEYDDFVWLWDIKTYKKFTEERHEKLSIQLGIYKILIENVFKKKCKIGGIILFEDFVNLQDETKLTIKKPINVKPILKTILKDRFLEIKKLKKS